MKALEATQMRASARPRTALVIPSALWQGIAPFGDAVGQTIAGLGNEALTIGRVREGNESSCNREGRRHLQCLAGQITSLEERLIWLAKSLSRRRNPWKIL